MPHSFKINFTIIFSPAIFSLQVITLKFRKYLSSNWGIKMPGTIYTNISLALKREEWATLLEKHSFSDSVNYFSAKH
jgi:hypothetical protein